MIGDKFMGLGGKGGTLNGSRKTVFSLGIIKVAIGF